MWPLNNSERPPPVPRLLAISCGRPAKSSPGGTSGLPCIASASGSNKSMLAPALPRPLGEIFLQRHFLPRRVARVTSGRVESDERARERDELVTLGLDRRADRSLRVGQSHAGNPNSRYRLRR